VMRVFEHLYSSKTASYRSCDRRRGKMSQLLVPPVVGQGPFVFQPRIGSFDAFYGLMGFFNSVGSAPNQVQTTQQVNKTVEQASQSSRPSQSSQPLQQTTKTEELKATPPSSAESSPVKKTPVSVVSKKTGSTSSSPSGSPSNSRSNSFSKPAPPDAARELSQLLGVPAEVCREALEKAKGDRNMAASILLVKAQEQSKSSPKSSPKASPKASPSNSRRNSAKWKKEQLSKEKVEKEKDDAEKAKKQEKVQQTARRSSVKLTSSPAKSDNS